MQGVAPEVPVPEAVPPIPPEEPVAEAVPAIPPEGPVAEADLPAEMPEVPERPPVTLVFLFC